MNGRSAVRPWRRQRAADRHRALRPIQSRCLPGFPFQVFTAISALIFSGVLDRFPRLKLGFFEVGIGWIPWLLDRLEMAYDARPAAREKAGRRPKECFNNFYLSLGSEDSTLAGCQTHRQRAADDRQRFSASRRDFAQYGSMLQTREGLTKKDIDNLLGGTAAEFFGLKQYL